MVQKFKTLGDLVALAEFAHRNQIDKSGQPYIDHPKRVLAKVQAMGGLPYVQGAAILHDVTEDTAFTPQMLLDLGVSEATVEVVKLVDRHESKKQWSTRDAARSSIIDSWSDLDNDEFKSAMGGWDYKTFGSITETADEYYYACIKNNPAALMVKLADIEDNLSPWRLSYLAPDTQERLKAKYTKALDILNG